MKIALFGGTFNPVHNEHVNIAKAAIEGLSLDKIIIIPSNETPGKHGKLLASGEDRLNMCRLAFKNVERAEVSDYELERGGVSYSYLTCRYFRQKYPDGELYFIIGADMLDNFRYWKNPEEILKCVTLAVCAREEPLKKSGYGAVDFGYVGAKISSTRIRTLAALGEDISGYVPESVADYIMEYSLYAVKKLRKVKDYLTPERLSHTVRVAIAAAENCSLAGVDELSAITAAALHDCAKYLKSDSAELNGFIPPEGVPEPVMHQYTGAFVAQNTFGINDEDILEAIRCHTSGKENMSRLCKLIYLADLLEEGRNFEGIEALRELFSRNIDGALYASLERQIEYLKSTGKPVYPFTMRAYEYLKENKNEQ